MFLFFRRLFPEISDEKVNRVYKPGRNYFELIFVSLMLLFAYVLLFNNKISNKSNGSIQDALDNQQFSKDLIVSCLIIITIMILERVLFKHSSMDISAIYKILHQIPEFSLRRDEQSYVNPAMCLKYLLHLVILFYVHYSLFVSLASANNELIFENPYSSCFYLLWVFYLYLSALQIRFGFPITSKGQFFSHNITLFNRIYFKVFKNVPFLFELRTLLDWTITRTSLDIYAWFKLEDAYFNLFDVKCDMILRKQRKEEHIPLREKLQYGSTFLLLMGILLLPMILFSSFNPSLKQNKLTGGYFDVSIVGINSKESVSFRVKVFETSSLTIEPVVEEEFTRLNASFGLDKEGVEKRQVSKVVLPAFPVNNLMLSSPTVRQIKRMALEDSSKIGLEINWRLDREYPINFKSVSGSKLTELNKEQKDSLYAILSRFGGESKESPSLVASKGFFTMVRLANKNWSYMRTEGKATIRDSQEVELQLNDDYKGQFYCSLNSLTEKKEFSFFAVSDDIVASILGINNGSNPSISIIGLYVSIVYAVGKFIRIYFDKISTRIVYEEMPQPENLLQLCESIYLYRNFGKLEEEKHLYDLLIRIFRSPETMIKITGG